MLKIHRLSPLLCAVLLYVVACLAGCGAADQDAATTLTIGAIPDQDPERLQRRFAVVADYLSRETGLDCNFVSVTSYTAAVTAFRNGDLDFVWFGGLTGVQARLQLPGAEAILQRQKDASFRSLFIANPSSSLKPFDAAEGLRALIGHRFSFGSESSTSGRLMPQHFLSDAGVSIEDFDGAPGFSGSHDKTLQLVASGAYEAGVLSEGLYRSRLADGRVQPGDVVVLWQTPPYYDYHWVLHPSHAKDRDAIVAAFLALSPDDEEQGRILELFDADKFIETRAENYAALEAIGRALGKIR